MSTPVSLSNATSPVVVSVLLVAVTITL
ncbi:MAG: hypothetical protein E6L02_02420 [Thaumarchaeota archaeon]|nr:MAG: hypothetical protein E6L02_02420 [Nitrososphaerota archaeon]